MAKNISVIYPLVQIETDSYDKAHHKQWPS